MSRSLTRYMKGKSEKKNKRVQVFLALEKQFYKLFLRKTVVVPKV